MLKSLRLLFVLFALLLYVSGLGGCSGTPTRHLASDVAMIKAGDTSRAEVLKLMGEPDSKRMLTPDTEEWAYYEESRSALQDTPFMGDSFDPNGYTMVSITFAGDVVETCNYRGYDEDEFDWQDDYSWQEIKK